MRIGIVVFPTDTLPHRLRSESLPNEPGSSRSGSRSLSHPSRPTNSAGRLRQGAGTKPLLASPAKHAANAKET